MYFLKSYFLVVAEDTLLQQVLAKYPNLNQAPIKVISDLMDKAENLQIIEAKTDMCLPVEDLLQEFSSYQKECWKVPQMLDFAVIKPQKTCNSFVLPVYGNFQDAEYWAQKWQKISWREAQKVYPVLIICHKTPYTSWVEFRGHCEAPDATWFENIRKICRYFTKSAPTFFFAEKVV